MNLISKEYNIPVSITNLQTVLAIVYDFFSEAVHNVHPTYTSGIITNEIIYAQDIGSDRYFASI